MTGDGPEPGQASQTQRVRVGMIGLACVFLLVMLVTALVSLGGGGRETAANSVAANDSAPREPLAELGVAPGAGESAAQPATSSAPAPTAQPNR